MKHSHSGLRKSGKGMIDMDKRSFVMGMITAFCECVAGGCKRLALSPPLKHEDYVAFRDEAEGIIEKHGLKHYHEQNLDLPDEDRFEWIIIALKQDTINEYLAIRNKGINPARSLEPFWKVLSYDPDESVHTGYDAFKEFFPDNM